MTVPPEVEAQILRLHHVENGAGARSHASCTCTVATVTRVLAQAGLPRTDPPQRPGRSIRTCR